MCEGWFTDDTPKRFEAYGWQVIRDVDGHDARPSRRAISRPRRRKQADADLLQDRHRRRRAQQGGHSHDVHGAPLGADEDRGCPRPHRLEPPALRDPGRRLRRLGRAPRGAALESKWNAPLRRLRAAHPELAAEFKRRMAGELPPTGPRRRRRARQDHRQGRDHRHAQGLAECASNAFGPAARTPRRLGRPRRLQPHAVVRARRASAQAAAATTSIYGVREFGMAAMPTASRCTAAHPLHRHLPGVQRLRAQRLRMAALMKQRQIFVFTHDSIGLGEDGPTHQPVEQTASLRLIPNMDVWRPCDATETASPGPLARSSARTARPRCASRARTCLPDAHAGRSTGTIRAAATCCRSCRNGASRRR
jgi:transketolase